MQSQKDSASLEIKPIAFVRSVFSHKFGTPRQGALAPSSQAQLELVPEWRGKGMFTGLEGFSHVWLVSVFHHNKNTKQAGKIHPPRLLGETIGVFASRSPHRPNPLGLTLARLEAVEGDCLRLSGVDLIDQTPIVDIKPYLAEADRPENYSSGWTERLEKSEVQCTFTTEAMADLERLRPKDQRQFVSLIEEVLRLDPRPLAYRARVNERFAIVLDGMDVHARFHESVFTVISIQPFVPQPKRPAKILAPKRPRRARRALHATRV